MQGVLMNWLGDDRFLVRIGLEEECLHMHQLEFPNRESFLYTGPNLVVPTQVVRRSRMTGALDKAENHLSNLRRMSKRRSMSKTKLLRKYVRIESGHHTGEIGYVIKGANGYYTVVFSADSPQSKEIIMRRAQDLKEVPRPQHFIHGSYRTSKSLKRKRFKSDGNNNEGGSPESQQQEEIPKRRRIRSLGGRESWIGRRVMIRDGKYRGEIGIVKRSGHGFYCLDIPRRGEIMKRGADLELFEDGAPRYRLSSNDLRQESTEVQFKKAAHILMDMLTSGDWNDTSHKLTDDLCDDLDDDGENFMLPQEYDSDESNPAEYSKSISEDDL